MTTAAPGTGLVPWWPDPIAAQADGPDQARAGWGYVVLEEVAGAVAELVRWPWPLADQLGHLVWTAADQDAAVTATVPVAVLRELMYLPSDLRRNPRSGDTFAAELGGSGWTALDGEGGAVTDLTRLFPGRVLDISADARDAAKLAYQGANAAVYDGSGAEDLLEHAARERRDRPAGPVVLAIEPPPEPEPEPDDGGGGG